MTNLQTLIFATIPVIWPNRIARQLTAPSRARAAVWTEFITRAVTGAFVLFVLTVFDAVVVFAVFGTLIRSVKARLNTFFHFFFVFVNTFGVRTVDVVGTVVGAIDTDVT